LKRAIQRYFLDPLALEIIDGRVVSGDSVKVSVDKKADNLKFSVEK
jgi:ATP-dependent Clp protease ATP-binding subunit ClpA